MVTIASFFHIVSRLLLTPPPAPARMKDDLDVDEACMFHDLEGEIIRVSCNCMVQGK